MSQMWRVEVDFFFFSFYQWPKWFDQIDKLGISLMSLYTVPF